MPDLKIFPQLTGKKLKGRSELSVVVVRNCGSRAGAEIVGCHMGSLARRHRPCRSLPKLLETAPQKMSSIGLNQRISAVAPLSFLAIMLIAVFLLCEAPFVPPSPQHACC